VLPARSGAPEKIKLNRFWEAALRPAVQIAAYRIDTTSEFVDKLPAKLMT
jgi:hypothetical protein